MLYSTIPTPSSLAVYLAGRPTATCLDTPASSVPSSSRAPSQPPEGRDLDFEDYNYQQEVIQATWRIPGPWQLYWQGFLTSAPRSWRLCCATCQFLTIQGNLLA